MREAAIRVPSVGLTSEEHRIILEGYRLAERMLRHYEEPHPGLLAIAGKWLDGIRPPLARLVRLLLGI